MLLILLLLLLLLLLLIIIIIIIIIITIGCGLDGRSVGVPIGARSFSSPCRPYRFWGPPIILSSEDRRLFPGGKGAGA
jgi:hypothetical protein